MNVYEIQSRSIMNKKKKSNVTEIREKNHLPEFINHYLFILIF